MTQRLGWDAQPTEGDAEAADRHLQAIAHPIAADTAPLPDVLQAQEDGRPAIPVRLIGPANIRNMGVRLAALRSRLLVLGAPPVRLLGANHRRAVLFVLSPSGVNANIRIGRSQAECADADSYEVIGNSRGPHIFRFTEELWARNSGDSGGDIRVSFAAEQWTR